MSREKAQKLVDKIFGGESIEFEGEVVCVPKWISELKVKRQSPAMVYVDGYITREQAIGAIAQTTWARGTARGMLEGPLGPEGFREKPLEEQRRMIEEKARRLAETILP